MLLLEEMWSEREHEITDEVGEPRHRSDLTGLEDPLAPAPEIPPSRSTPFFHKAMVKILASRNKEQAYDIYLPPSKEGNNKISLVVINTVLTYDHLIYAYMIENTRVFEVFRRVVHELVHGEKLGVLRQDAQHWVRATEALFFRDPPPYSILSISSQVRPDGGASRRNAYQRMFGMNLNHGTDDGKPYPFVTADASNREFVPTFEEFLREIWVGIVNVGNTSGAKPTDSSKIFELAKKLHDMLLARRKGGSLSQEEFVFVSMMSWFDLALATDSPIVKSLSADASSAEQRLFKIAQRVGLPAHGLAASYFDIAEPISQLLIDIEKNLYDNEERAESLYKEGTTRARVQKIITHWSMITGREVKAKKVATT
ncbi:MAG: hypothetical protein OEY86_06605 [Nitrospira sp.]|nr:hypothetical protein [Nitrospira sp.]